MSKDELKSNKTDTIVSAMKATSALIPYAGTLIGELIGSIIPNQRFDRLVKYVTMLDEKIANIDIDKLRKFFSNAECVDLFEEGFVQASRVITDERRTYIASIVRNGLDEKALAYSEAKFLLKLLQELGDQEIIWLQYYGTPTRDFQTKHENILKGITVYYGADESLSEKKALQDSYKEHLERLGLITSHFEFDNETDKPAFDSSTGKPLIAYWTITGIGRLLLKQIGLLSLKIASKISPKRQKTNQFGLCP